MPTTRRLRFNLLLIVPLLEFALVNCSAASERPAGTSGDPLDTGSVSEDFENTGDDVSNRILDTEEPSGTPEEAIPPLATAVERDKFLIGAFFGPTWALTNDTQYDYLREAKINFLQDFYPNDYGIGSVEQMNAVLALCSARGIKAQVADARTANLTDANIDAIAKTYKNNQGTGGYYVKDEPTDPATFPTYAHYYNRFLANDPQSIPNVNMAGYNGTRALSLGYTWIDSVGALNLKYLTFDHYPYGISGGIDQSYYQVLQQYRDMSLSKDVRFGNYIQSVGWNHARIPNAFELSLDVYTALAFGAKTFNYFTWFQPVISGSSFTPAIIDAKGNKTALYAPVQAVNSQVMALGPTLMGLTSRDVFFAGALPNGVTAVPPGSFFQPTTKNNQILGHFVDAAGRSYVMVVNRDYAGSKTLAFNLAAKPSSVTEISKTTGTDVATNYSRATGDLSDSFAPGEGKLYAISSDFLTSCKTANDVDAAITYRGTWTYSSVRRVGDYADDVHHTSTNGDYFSYTFSGTGVDLISETDPAPGAGDIDIYIDGAFQKTVSCVGPIRNRPQQVVYSIRNMTNVVHTIKGVKRSGKFMVVDALRTYDGPIAQNIVTTNDNYRGLSYSGSWGVSSNRGVGNYHDDVHYTTSNGSYFVFSFLGESVSFASETSPGYGDIDIYIDNVFQRTINCNGSRNNRPAVVYAKTGLTYGQHTLKGVKRSGNYMVVDGFAK